MTIDRPSREAQGRLHHRRRARRAAHIFDWRPTARTSSRLTSASRSPACYPLSTADDLAATVELVEDAGGGMARQGDHVRDRASRQSHCRRALTRVRPVTSWWLNAGIAMMQAGGDDGWRGDVIGVSLTRRLPHRTGGDPDLIEQGTGGSIVLISSAAGLVGIGSNPGSLGYAAITRRRQA